jgi:hypothetical protein
MQVVLPLALCLPVDLEKKLTKTNHRQKAPLTIEERQPSR